MNETATSAQSDTIDRIEEVLASIRPAVRADGGDIDLVGYDPESGVVHVRMLGACYACPMSQATLRAAVEQNLRLVIPDITAVEAV